jgi:predicted dehydrogenase
MSGRPEANVEVAEKPVRIGLIGGGFIAQVAHLHALSQISQAHVVALSEPDKDLRDAVSRRFGIESGTGAFEEILERDDIEALVICVPRRAQSHLVTRALSAPRSVLSEKPMAMSLNEATNMLEVARHSGASWAIGYMKRYDAGVQRFASLLAMLRASGELGNVVDVQMRDFCGTYGVPVPAHARRSGPRQLRYAEGSVAPEFVPAAMRAEYEYTLNVASHDINLLRLLFGDALKPTRFLVRPSGVQHLIFDAGAFSVSLVVAPVDVGRWDQRLDVIFERGKVSLVLPSPLARQESAVVVLERSGHVQVTTIPASEHVWSFEAQARCFVESVRQGTAMITNGDACLGDIAMIEEFWKRVERP